MKIEDLDLKFNQQVYFIGDNKNLIQRSNIIQITRTAKKSESRTEIYLENISKTFQVMDLFMNFDDAAQYLRERLEERIDRQRNKFRKEDSKRVKDKLTQ